MKGAFKSTNQEVTLHFRNLKLTSATGFPKVLFTPPAGQRFLPQAAFVDLTDIDNVNTAPHILIDNGTDTQDIVANVALGTTENRDQQLTVIAGRVVDHDNPLRLKLPTLAAANAGTPEFVADVMVRGWIKSE